MTRFDGLIRVNKKHYRFNIFKRVVNENKKLNQEIERYMQIKISDLEPRRVVRFLSFNYVNGLLN
jgi:hypothetical protein